MSSPQGNAVPDVRERILQEATRLFARKGYGSTSVRELVEAAGVTKPTLYYWFGSKEALFLEVIRTHVDELDSLVAEALRGPGTVQQRLATFAERYVRGAVQNVDAVKVLMTAHHPADDQPHVDMMTMHLRKIELLRGVVEEGMQTGELRSDLQPAAAVMAFIGMVNMHVMARVEGMCMPDDFVNTLMDLYFNGVAAR